MCQQCTIREKDRDLIRFSHQKTIELPTGIKVSMDVYHFKNGKYENTSGILGQSGLWWKKY